MPRGFRDDVSLYAFLLDADPGGCSLEAHGRAAARSARRAARRRAGELHSRTQRAPAAGDRSPRLAASSTKTSNCRSRAFWRAWSTPESASIPTNWRGFRACMETGIARAHRARFMRSRGANSTSRRRSSWAKILFEEMGLPAPVRYGKGKTISTAADVLEALAAEHEIVRQGARIPAADQAQRHLCGRAAGADRPRDRPHPHQLQSDRRGDGPPVVLESEPAEHSDQDGAGARDPRGFHSARRLEAGGGGLFADRAAAAGAYVGGSGADRRVPAAARISIPARRRK